MCRFPKARLSPPGGRSEARDGFRLAGRRRYEGRYGPGNADRRHEEAGDGRQCGCIAGRHGRPDRRRPQKKRPCRGGSEALLWLLTFRVGACPLAGLPGKPARVRPLRYIICQSEVDDPAVWRPLCQVRFFAFGWTAASWWVEPRPGPLPASDRGAPAHTPEGRS